MDSTVYEAIRKPFIFGAVLHTSLLFIGSMGGETSLNVLAGMVKDNPVVYGFCWIPSICYLLCCLILIGVADGKEMFKFALILLIGIPLLAMFGVGLIWGLILFGIAFGILFAMGLEMPVIAIAAIVGAPGLVIAALCFFAFAGMSFVGSFMFSF